jgi:hypothetical protein
MSDPADGPFTADDLRLCRDLVVRAWGSGVDRDWSVPAGTLEWTCWKTADHTVDCVFSYALFLASRRLDSYPPFGELHALEAATPSDLVEGLQAVTTMLWSVIVTAPPGTRAVITQGPVRAGTPADFAARGALEMVLHAHDVCLGLGIPFQPPAEVCARLRDHTNTWPGSAPAAPTDDPWSDLLVASGRSR